MKPTEQYLLLGVAAIAVWYISKKGLFEPAGTTKTGLSALNERIGVNDYPAVGATYIPIGSTTYRILDSDLPQTGFIRRRASLVAALPSWMQTDWMREWVYS